jgi:hypothetical protein
MALMAEELYEQADSPGETIGPSASGRNREIRPVEMEIEDGRL